MCRESLPVWQKLADENSGRIDIVGIALGAERDRVATFVEQYAVAFPTLLDPEYRMADVFGFRQVRNGLLFDEGGRLQHAQIGGFDIRLFDVWHWGIRLSSAVDVAPRYLDWGISIGFWH